MKQVIEDMPKGDKFKFAYAATKNLRKIKSEIDDMQSTIEPDSEFREYDKERQEVCKKFARIENGEPAKKRITNPDGSFAFVFEIDEKKKREFNEELKKLKSKYKEVISSQEKKIENFNLEMRKMVDIDFHRVSCEDLPTEMVEIQEEEDGRPKKESRLALTPNQMEAILDWIEFPDEEKKIIKTKRA
jgi:hypothetical protein